jgi:hypothetical protein
MPGDYLSPEGRRRQEQILQMALRDMRNTRRRRWILPGVGAVAAVGLVLLVSIPRPQKALVMAMKSVPAVAVPIAPRSGAEAPGPVEPMVQFVETDPTIADRLTLKPQAPRWVVVDDDQFVKALADAGKPMGLAYVNGKAILLGRE